MSDWTSGFDSFQRGMALLGEGRYRRKREDMEKTQMELERERYEQNKKLTDAQIKAMDRRINRPAVTSPGEDFEVVKVEQDEFGNPVTTYGKKPRMFNPDTDVTTMPDGTRVFRNPNTGNMDVVKPDAMTQFLKNMGPQVQPPSTPAAAATPSEWRPPLRLPGPAVQPPATATATSATTSAQPALRLSGIGPSGPIFDVVNPVEEPTIVERLLPDGSKQKFLRSVDPKSGKVDLNPYNIPGGQMSSEAEDKLNVTLMAMDNLPAIRQAVTKAGDYGGPVASRVTAPYEWAFGPREDRRAFQRLEAESLVPLAKGILGETGALSETEQQRYKGLLPTFSDTQTARNEKYAELKRLLTDSARNRISLMKAKGQDTGPIEKEFSNKLAIIEAVEQGAPTFRNEDEVNAAAKLGKLTPGKPVVVNGRVAVWNP